MFIHRLLPHSILHGATVHPPSTSSSHHLLLFIHCRLPPASTSYCSSTGSCSSSLHWLLFIQPSTGYCSSSPPPATVQPALHGVLFIHPQPARSGSCSSSSNGLYYTIGPVHPTPAGNCSSNPQQCSLFIKRQMVRSASVSSSSEGIARLGSVNSQGWIDRSGSVTRSQCNRSGSVGERLARV